MGNGIPFQEIANLFGVTLSPWVLAVLSIAQWVVGFLFLVSGYTIAWYQGWQRRKLQEEKRKRELEGHDPDFIVVGAGAVTLVDPEVAQRYTHNIQTFGERNLEGSLGRLLADEIREASEVTARTHGTQLLHIKDANLRRRIFARITNLVNDCSDPFVVGFLAQTTGWSKFVICLSWSDDPDSKKARLVIRHVDELMRYKKGGLLHSAAVSGKIAEFVEFEENFHCHDAVLTAEVAEKWFADPTPNNEFCRQRRLFGKFVEA